MANTYITSGAALTSVADAIRAKGGTSQPLTYPAEFISAIGDIRVGVQPEPSDVNFYDYDGTLTAAYTAAEFQALTALPTNPVHEGLTAQGWNWTLAGAKAYVAAHGFLDIGQMYITSDGKTRVWIELGPNTASNRMTFSLYLGESANGGVTVHWGDGATTTLSGTNSALYSHTYAQTGCYEIAIEVTSGELQLAGSSSYSLYGASASSNRYNASRIRRVALGANVSSLGTYILKNCTGLESISIPQGVTLENYAFTGCKSLRFVTIPTGNTQLSSYAFSECVGLACLSLPAGLTALEANALSGCKTLVRIAVPDTVTTLGDYLFQSCESLRQIAFSSGLTSIGSSAMATCISLSELTIPAGVTSLPDSLFSQDCGLTRLTISAGVSSIDANALAFLYGLGELWLLPTTPPTLSSSTNIQTSGLVIYVPYSSDHSILAAYQAASQWSNLASRMQEAPE